MKQLPQIRAQFDTAMTASMDIYEHVTERGDRPEDSPEWAAMTAVCAALSWVIGRDEFDLTGMMDAMRNVDTRKSLDEG